MLDRLYRGTTSWKRYLSVTFAALLLADISVEAASSLHDGSHLFDQGTRPENPAELQLMKQIGCTCGECKVLPIDQCECAFAAQMRRSVKAEISSGNPDLSSDAGRARAIEHARKAVLQTYGQRALLTAENGLMDRIMVAVIVGGAVIVFAKIALSKRSRARARTG